MLVMKPQVCLGGRRVNGLRQLVRFLQSLRQLDSADCSVLLIAFPAASGNITPDNALHWKHIQLPALHAVSVKILTAEKFRHIFDIHRKHMIGHDIFGKVEPKFRHLC